MLFTSRDGTNVIKRREINMSKLGKNLEKATRKQACLWDAFDNILTKFLEKIEEILPTVLTTLIVVYVFLKQTGVIK